MGYRWLVYMYFRVGFYFVVVLFKMLLFYVERKFCIRKFIVFIYKLGGFVGKVVSCFFR